MRDCWAIETALEAALQAHGVDFDFEIKPGGVLELEFADGSKIIVNRHAAAREIWLAAKSGGFIFGGMASLAWNARTARNCWPRFRAA